MSRSFLGIDATVVPFRTSHGATDGAPEDEQPASAHSVPGPRCKGHWITQFAPPDEKLIVSTSFDRDLLRSELERLSSRLKHQHPIAVIAHPAMLPPPAIERMVAQAKEAGFLRVEPIAAPLAAVLGELQVTAGADRRDRTILTCTPGLGTKAMTPTWEWLAVRCCRGDTTGTSEIHPDWFCATSDDMAASPGNDIRDYWRLERSLSSLPLTQRILCASQEALTHVRNRKLQASTAVSTNASGFEEVDAGAVARGAAEFARWSSEPEAQEAWTLAGRIPLPVGVLGTMPGGDQSAPSAMYWRELSAGPDGIVPNLTFNKSQIWLATLPGYSSANEAPPRWLALSEALTGSHLCHYRAVKTQQAGTRGGDHRLRFPKSSSSWSYNLPQVQQVPEGK